MKNIELLPITDEAKKRINELALQYRRYAHIIIEVVSFKDNRLIVRAEQKDLINKKQLTRKDLEQRVHDMFKGEIPDAWKLTISAADFDRSDIDNITTEWIANRMEKLNLKAKHISTYTGIDKSTLSVLLSGEKDLTKWHKVAFYYFFKYRELSDFNNK